MTVTNARMIYIATNYGVANCVDEHTYEKMADAEMMGSESFTYDEYEWAANNVGWYAQTPPEMPVCSWITSVGGKNNVLSASITDAILGYKNMKDLGFTVHTSDIAGLILYYKKQMTAGDSMTGCS